MEGEGDDGDEDEDDNEEEELEGDILGDIREDTLLISRHLTDDNFVGRLSKFVFQRLPTQSHIFLTYQQEISVYIRFHILPTLREILYDSPDRFYIWIAANTQFFKDGSFETKCERWSSFR